MAHLRASSSNREAKNQAWSSFFGGEGCSLHGLKGSAFQCYQLGSIVLVFSMAEMRLAPSLAAPRLSQLIFHDGFSEPLETFLVAVGFVWGEGRLRARGVGMGLWSTGWWRGLCCGGQCPLLLFAEGFSSSRPSILALCCIFTWGWSTWGPALSRQRTWLPFVLLPLEMLRAGCWAPPLASFTGLN